MYLRASSAWKTLKEGLAPAETFGLGRFSAQSLFSEVFQSSWEEKQPCCYCHHTANICTTLYNLQRAFSGFQYPRRCCRAGLIKGHRGIRNWMMEMLKKEQLTMIDWQAQRGCPTSWVLMDGVDFYRQKWALGRESHMMNGRYPSCSLTPLWSMLLPAARMSFLKAQGCHCVA